MKKIYILFLVITSYACTAQILLNGRLIHELPAKSSVDTGDLIIVANPTTGKPYKARKNQVVAGANGVTDGDKGDITVSGSGGVFTIDGSSVQNGKLAMMGDNTFKGNLSGTTASPQDLTAGQVISALGINLKMAYTDTASLSNRINAKQNTLVSGTNIKSVNGNSLIGSGDVTITSSVAWGNITGSNIMLQTDLRDSFEHRIAAGTTGQYWRGDKTWQTLNKAAVGLSAVDNTPDVDKPISNATNAALAGKQAQLVSGTNIKTINFIDLLGSGNINISGGGGGSQTLDQTLNLGNITDTNMVFKYLGSPPNANSMTPVIAFEIPAIDTFRSQVPFKFLRWSLEQTGGAQSATVAHNEGLMFGFNFTPGGGQETAGKPSLFESWETNYLPDWATRYVEKHEIYYAQNTGGGVGPGTGILGARLSSYTINTSNNYIDFYHTVDTWRLVPKANPSLSYFAIQPGNFNILNQYLNKNFRLEFTDSTLLTLNSGTVPISIVSGGVDLSDGNLTNFRTPGFKSDGLAIVKNNGNIGSSPDHYFYVSQNGLILRNLTTEALGISFSTGTTTFNGYGTGSTLTFSSWAAMNFNSIPIENFAMPSQIKQTSIGIWRTDGNTGSSAEEYMNLSQNGIVIRNLTNTNVVQFGVASAGIFHIRGFDLAEEFKLLDFNDFNINTATVSNAKGYSFKTGASDPTTSDIPDGYCTEWKNTTNGELRRWCNDGGTMKKSATLTN